MKSAEGIAEENARLEPGSQESCRQLHPVEGYVHGQTRYPSFS